MVVPLKYCLNTKLRYRYIIWLYFMAVTLTISFTSIGARIWCLCSSANSISLQTVLVISSVRLVRMTCFWLGSILNQYNQFLVRVVKFPNPEWLYVIKLQFSTSQQRIALGIAVFASFIMGFSCLTGHLKSGFE